MTFLALLLCGEEASGRDEFLLLVLLVESGINHVVAVEVGRVPVGILGEFFVDTVLVREMFSSITV